MNRTNITALVLIDLAAAIKILQPEEVLFLALATVEVTLNLVTPPFSLWKLLP